jgi:hypothetical protein
MAVSRKSIDDVFQELFGRDAEDEGANYWMSEVEAGKVPKSDLRGAILHSAWTADLSSQGADMKHYRSIEAI